MPPTRARKPGLLNRQFGFPGATGKQKNPAFAFVPDQGKNKRRIFWFRKQTNRSFAKRNSLKNSFWSAIRHFSRTDKSAFNRGRKPASLCHLNKSKNGVNVAQNQFLLSHHFPAFPQGRPFSKSRESIR